MQAGRVDALTVDKLLLTQWMCRRADAVEPDLIATEMLAFPSKSSRNKNGSDPINAKTTLI